MINKQNLSKIGIGTWGIGGFAERNPNNDDKKQVEALIYMLQNGLNYIEINYWTAQGHSFELVKQAIDQSGVKRGDIFLSQSIYAYTAPDLDASKKELEDTLKLFGTDYIDSLALSSGLVEEIGQDNVFTWLKQLVAEKKIRFVNLNNPSIEQLQIVHKTLGQSLFSIEVGYNFEIRENDDSGILGYATKNGILPVIYQPLRRNRTANHNWPLLAELSKKYSKTQNQILLNWIVSLGYLPLTKSESIDHIKEHLDSLSFQIDQSDLDRMTQFRPPNYKKPQVYWGAQGEGVRIDQLSNVFDDDYAKQQAGE